MNRYQIRLEERALLVKFGNEYEQYMTRVRRWVLARFFVLPESLTKSGAKPESEASTIGSGPASRLDVPAPMAAVSSSPMLQHKMKSERYYLPILIALVIGASCLGASVDANAQESTQPFQVRITDPPLTFTNPITINVGSERARRAGEAVVVLHQDTYYLFVTGRGGGYWASDNFRDWT